MADNAAGFVGSIPEHYDNGLGPVIFVDYASEMATRVAALKPGRVLETAAGTGIVSRRLRDLLPAEARLTATDLNPPMLEVARAKFAEGEQIELRPADAQALPFANASFDLVVCQFGVMFYPGKDKSYRETFRVLAPGGHYLFSLWDSHRYNPFGRITHALVGAEFPDDPPQFQAVPFAYRFEPAKDSLLAAGFDDIQAAIVKIDKVIPDIRAFARGLVYGSPILDQMKARGGANPDQIVDKLVAALEGEFGTSPSHMPLQATFVSARKPG